MKDNFDKSLAAVLKHEGGFVHHPRDPGGMTNLGCTKKTWEGWVGYPVDEAAMRALTPADVAPLYKVRYWDAIRADELPSGVDYAMFDVAINSGPKRAVLLAQKIAGVTQDGAIGPKTLAAIKEAVDRDGHEAFISSYSEARETFLRSLPTFDTFGRGWMRRVDEVEAVASVMATSEVG